VEGDPSFAWAQTRPLWRSTAITELNRLKLECTGSQRRLRDEAFVKAERFINAGPVDACAGPVLRTFQNRNLPRHARNARVDVEIRRGIAFS
jgi:hypothetical protein